MTLTDTDGALPVARRRLDDAVARLADPRPQWLDGVLRCEAALYERLRGALNGAVVARRQVHTSRVPCRVDV